MENESHILNQAQALVNQCDMALYDAAISFMPCGFSMWSENLELVLFNQLYLDIYKLPEEKIVKGLPLFQLCEISLDARYERDFGDTNNRKNIEFDEYYSRIRQSLLNHQDPDAHTYDERVIWGRTIRVSIARRPGLGWLVTHEDVTASAEQMEALRVREAELKLQNIRIDAAVENMAHGLAMFDGEEKLVISNRKYARLYGLPDALCQPGISFDDIFSYRMKTGLIQKGGAESHKKIFRECLEEGACRDVVFEMENGKSFSILHQKTQDGGWVSIHEDVTEEKQKLEAQKLREIELRLQNSRFDAAIENMVSGLAMFDAEHKLVICNSQFVQLYDLPRELAQPGAKFSKIMEHRINIGMVPESAENSFLEGINNLIANGLSSKDICEMRNGRFVSISHQAVEDGGWVSIHEDVTLEHQRLNALESRKAELSLQNSRFNAAVGNMAHGLAMYDANQKLVVCNRRYRELYMLPENLAQPGTLFEEIVLWIGKSGHAPTGGVEPDIDLLVEAIKKNASKVLDYEMDNGKTYTIIDKLTDEGGWVSIHEDVTEERQRINALKMREAELVLQNNRFEAAVVNMTHGLSMFDADQKLIICNDYYRDIYDIPPHLGEPGTLFGDILEYRATVGSAPIDVEKRAVADVAQEVAKGIATDAASVTKVWEMQNGRQISVSYRPISDGGWVSIHEDVTQRLKEEEQIRHLAHHDSLTDLPNRTYFGEELKKAEFRVVRGEQVAILCLDLDRFKEINDNLGHGVGDEVLKQVAERLNKSVREQEMVARMGGDEFMVLIGPLERPQQAALVARRILDEFSQPMNVEGHQLKIGTSIGIAVAPLDGTDGATLMKNADRALYRAKEEGGGVFHFFEKGMDNEIHRRQSMEADLLSALDQNQFSLTFQPILELESNRISSCEVLVNWNHPKLGRLSTEDFVQLAHETGVNDKLVQWMFEQACKEAAAWPKQVRVSINMSTFKFGRINLVNVIGTALKRSGLDAARLEVGVNECYLIKNTKPTLKILHRLQKLGVRLSMDEFGKESTSLNHLRAFSFDKINLHRTVVADTAENQENREIAKAVIGLGRSLGIVMNGVGVDKESQLDFLRDLGCNEVQGYLFSPPLPNYSIGELLRTVERRAAIEMGVANPSGPIDRVMDL